MTNQEKTFWNDLEYQKFLKENLDNNMSLLTDFTHFLLIHLFDKGSFDDHSVESAQESLEVLDKTGKYIETLLDTLGPFIRSYVKWDLGCAYKRLPQQNQG